VCRCSAQIPTLNEGCLSSTLRWSSDQFWVNPQLLKGSTLDVDVLMSHKGHAIDTKGCAKFHERVTHNSPNTLDQWILGWMSRLLAFVRGPRTRPWYLLRRGGEVLPVALTNCIFLPEYTAALHLLYNRIWAMTDLAGCIQNLIPVECTFTNNFGIREFYNCDNKGVKSYAPVMLQVVHCLALIVYVRTCVLWIAHNNKRGELYK